MHGAWHDSGCWRLLAPLLTARGDEVHTPDLPGHGQNPLELANISINVYSRYISQYIDNIGKKVILVGHSMSGMVISKVAEQSPELIQRLIYLSAYLPANGQSLFDLIQSNKEALNTAPIELAMQMSEDKRSCSISTASIGPLFYNRCDKGFIPTSFPPQATLPLSGKVTLTEEGFGRVVKTYICCQDDQVIPVAHQRHMLKGQACNEMVQLDCDHSPFYSCPEVLAAVLHSASLPV